MDERAHKQGDLVKTLKIKCILRGILNVQGPDRTSTIEGMTRDSSDPLKGTTVAAREKAGQHTAVWRALRTSHRELLTRSLSKALQMRWLARLEDALHARTLQPCTALGRNSIAFYV